MRREMVLCCGREPRACSARPAQGRNPGHSGACFRCGVDPQALGIKGSTQPEIFEGTVDAIAKELRNDPTRFWQESFSTNGPMEIWEINGERFLYNGNHRFQAALREGVEIPPDNTPARKIRTWVKQSPAFSGKQSARPRA